MFAWLMRLFMIGLGVVVVWNFAPRAVDNFWAIESGVPGTVSVQDCRVVCHGPFASRDGKIHIGNVDLVSVGASLTAEPGHDIDAHVASRRSTGAHLTRDWPQTTMTMLFLLLGVGFALMLLTPGNDRRLQPGRAVSEAATQADLGNASVSIRSAAYRWFLVGSVVLVFGLAPVVGFLTVGDGPATIGQGLSVNTVAALAVGGALLLLAALLIGRGITGIGRQLHLFEGGFVVSRPWRLTTFRYADVVDAKTSLSRVPEDGPARPHAIRLTFTDGAALTIREPAAVAAIMERVPRPD